jgi:hypothetical protein
MRVAILVFAALTGCYGTANRPPKRPDFPEIREGAVARVTTHGVAARLERGSVQEEHSVLHFSYDGARRTYGEYRGVVDPSWKNTLNQYDRLYEICKHSMKPAKVGGTIVLAGMLTAIYGLSLEKEDKDKSQKVMLLGGGIAGAGGLVWGGGYFFGGGRSCAQAKSMWRKKYLYQTDNDDPRAWSDIASEMETLTEEFNRRRGNAN